MAWQELFARGLALI